MTHLKLVKVIESNFQLKQKQSHLEDAVLIVVRF